MSNQIKIRYVKSFVAFIDVLGFSEIVNDNRPEGIQKLNTYFTIINDVITKLRNIEEKRDIGYITISDSIVLTIPQDCQNKMNNTNNLRQLCIAVGEIQSKLARSNIWVRGAISSGDAYFNSKRNQIVGPAYISAYNLENSIAKYPRVIIDSKIVSQLGFHNATEFIKTINTINNRNSRFISWGTTVLFCWEDQIGYPRTLIPRDVPLFIDYLCPIVERGGDDLLAVIQNIENNIYRDTRLYEKYRWVADYLKMRYWLTSDGLDDPIEIRIDRI